MKIEDIRRVLIVGAGTMGRQIGTLCAMHGYDVVLYDIASDSLEGAFAQVKKYTDQFVSEGRLTPEEEEKALGRITTTANPEEAATEADLVSESVLENPELKGKVFGQFNELCPSRTIFTTNTSSLMPSTFAEATGRPTQFAALHFHSPMTGANVVDIMPHLGTSEETTNLVIAFARRIGQTPILLKKESPGYVYEVMQSAFTGVALYLLVGEVASIEDIDRAWMGVTKMPIGPLGIMDHVGLDTVWQIIDYQANQSGDPGARAVADLLKGYVDKGWLGVKSGRGFYTYPDPEYQQPGFLEG